MNEVQSQTSSWGVSAFCRLKYCQFFIGLVFCWIPSPIHLLGKDINVKRLVIFFFMHVLFPHNLAFIYCPLVPQILEWLQMCWMMCTMCQQVAKSDNCCHLMWMMTNPEGGMLWIASVHSHKLWAPQESCNYGLSRVSPSFCNKSHVGGGSQHCKPAINNPTVLMRGKHPGPGKRRLSRGL